MRTDIQFRQCPRGNLNVLSMKNVDRVIHANCYLKAIVMEDLGEWRFDTLHVIIIVDQIFNIRAYEIRYMRMLLRMRII